MLFHQTVNFIRLEIQIKMIDRRKFNGGFEGVKCKEYCPLPPTSPPPPALPCCHFHRFGGVNGSSEFRDKSDISIIVANLF